MKKPYLRVRKSVAAVTAVLFTFNPLFPLLTPLALADEVDAGVVESTTLPGVSESPAPTTEPTVEPIVESATPTPSETPAPPVEQAADSPEASVAPTNTDDGIWQLLPNGKALTREPVSIYQTYTAPQNKDVTVHFTKLPDEVGTLTIKEIKLTADEQKNSGAVSDTAYDISSSMPNGSFRYTLTLPKPEGAKDVTVKYAETQGDLGEAQDVKEATDEKATAVTVTGLDHFTVFVLVNNTDTDGTPNNGNEIANGALSAIEDSYIEQNTPTSNHDTSVDLSVKSRSGQNQRFLLKFDLSSYGAGTPTLTNATLRLFMNNAPTNSRTITVKEASTSWAESTLMWNNQPATAATISSAATGTTNNQWVEFDVTGEVQSIINGSTTNNGWAFMDATEDVGTNNDNQAKFNSSDVGVELKRPQLVLDFATAATAPTSYNSPTAEAASGGNGFETTPTGAFTDGGVAATHANNAAGESHDYFTYNFSIPAGATINGVETRADWWLGSTSGTNSLSVQLSSNGGSSWTTAKSDITETDAEHVASLGSSSDLWGRTWSASDFNNANFRVRATMNATSASNDFFLDWIPVRVYYTPDTTTPTLTEVTPVTTPTNDNTPAYTFSATEAGTVTYGGDCTSATTSAAVGNNTVTFNTLADGAHSNCTITVTDAAGNASTPLAVSAFTIDNTAPAVPSLVSPADNSFVQPTSVILDWSDVTDLSSPVNYQYQSALSSAVGPQNALSAPIYTSALQLASQIDASGSPHNAYYWQVRACDSAPASNCSAWSGPWKVTIDGTAPTDPTDAASTSHVVSVPSNVTSIHMAWSLVGSAPGATDALAGVDGYSYSFTQGATDVPDAVKDIEQDITGADSAALADGTWYFHLRTVDNAGNWTSTVHAGPFVIDTVAPTLAEVTPVTTPTNDNTPAYTFSATEAGTVTYGGDCTSATASAAVGNNTITFASLADGAHTNCTVKVTDTAGNQSAALNVSSFTIDTVAPVTTSSGIDAAWHNADVTVTLTCADVSGSGCAATYYSTDGNDPQTNPGSRLTYTVPFTLSVTGQYSVMYYSVDNASNAEATKDGGTVKIDKVLPTIPVLGALLTPTNNPVVAWTWSAAADLNSGIQTYAWRIVNAAATATYSGTTTALTYSQSLADDVWSFFVEAIDNATNHSGEATNTVTVDTIAPATPVPNIASGDFFADISVALSSSDLNGYSIYYTTDGSTPTAASTLYTGPISMTASTHLKAIAIDAAANSSAIFDGTYAIAPLISSQSMTGATTAGTATIVWGTDDPSTSRVVYAGFSVPVLGAGPNYGYAESTAQFDLAPNKVTNHSVTLTGLEADKTYYYRVVSAGSPETVGSEGSFTTGTSQESSYTGGGGTGSQETTTASSSANKGKVLSATTKKPAPAYSTAASTSLALYTAAPASGTQSGSGRTVASGDVLGETTASPSPQPSPSPEVTVSPSPAAETASNATSAASPWWWLLLIVVIGGAGYYIYRSRSGV